MLQPGVRVRTQMPLHDIYIGCVRADATHRSSLTLCSRRLTVATECTVQNTHGSISSVKIMWYQLLLINMTFGLIRNRVVLAFAIATGPTLEVRSHPVRCARSRSAVPSPMTAPAPMRILIVIVVATSTATPSRCWCRRRCWSVRWSHAAGNGAQGPPRTAPRGGAPPSAAAARTGLPPWHSAPAKPRSIRP